MAERVDDGVKSAGRVFAVLELFDRVQMPLSATAIERELDFPQSSTLALLKTMVALGYLSFDRIDRCYLPTPRVTLLGHWLEAAMEGEVGLQALLEEIGDATGETAALSCQNDLVMQFLAVRPGRNPLTLNARAGDTGPLFRSIIGLSALSQKTDRDIRRLADRIARRPEDGAPPVDIVAVLAEIAAIRRDGHGTGYSRYIHSVGAIAWPLPTGRVKRPIVLSVAGPVESIRATEADIIRTVDTILAAHWPKPHARGED